MGISSRIDTAQRRVFTEGAGVLTDAEMLAHPQELLSDSDFDPSFDQIVDATTFSRLDVTTDAIMTLAEHSPFLPTSRRALVIESDMQFGLARQYLLFVDGDMKRLHAFRTMEDAEAWLDDKADVQTYLGEHPRSTSGSSRA